MTARLMGYFWLDSRFPCLIFSSDGKLWDICQPVRENARRVKWWPECHPKAKTLLPPECSVGNTLQTQSSFFQ